MENDTNLIENRFKVVGGPDLLDTLDDPGQLIQVMQARGHELSVAEVLLSEILSHMREDVHRGRQALRTVGITQSAAGYFKLAVPPSANQYLKVTTLVVTMDAAGTLQFVEGSPGGTGDPGIGGELNMGVMTLQTGGLLSLHAPEPGANPLFVTSPGMTLGLVSGTGKAAGFVSYQVSTDLE